MNKPNSIFTPQQNCWRVERATRVAMIVDAAAYFEALRKAILSAREAIYLVGWDFDLRIEMMPGQSDADGNAPDGMPNALGDFITAVVEKNEQLDVYILKWDGAMLAAVGSKVVPTLWMELFSDSRIHFALDSHHPVGACHHSKIVVIDDQFAFCGGIDATEIRWDTPEHAPDDKRRRDQSGEPYQPWHDVTTALEGPVAEALGDLSRMRWKQATNEELQPPRTGQASQWPDDLEADMENVDVAIARTAPRYHGEPLINEIEELYLSIINGARETLYLESQYLAAGSLCDALKARLAEPDGPEIVVINPESAASFMEDEAMHSVRSLMIEELQDADVNDRFRIWYPVNSAQDPIYVHAKVVIADDDVLRVGSSNIDNRSMGFDTECDVAVQGTNQRTRKAIADFRLRLLSEHLDCSERELRKAIKDAGSLIAAIESLNDKDGRGLRAIEAHDLDPLEKALAETRLFDPRYEPDTGERVKHAVKRGISPYHLEATAGASAFGVLAAVGIVAVAGWYIAKRLRRGRDLSAPGIITPTAVRPPVRRDLRK